MPQRMKDREGSIRGGGRSAIITGFVLDAARKHFRQLRVTCLTELRPEIGQKRCRNEARVA